LRDDQSGNVAAIFALALVPAVGLIGAAVDYSRGNATRSSMQAAVDATALNLVKSASSLTSDQLSQKATDSFNALFNGSQTQSGVQVNAQYNAPAKSVTMSATGSIKTDFMGVMGQSSLAVRARAVAVVIGEGTACVLALNKTASGAAIAQGSTTVNLTGCSLYDNSGNASALTVGGSAKLSALSVGVVGGISGNAAITATNGVSTGVSPVPDPYAKLEVPSFSGCHDHNFTAKNKVTIDPGVYCGGMKLNAGADVTLNPGIYFIDKGDLTVNGGATLTGAGVTIIFTSSTMSNWPTASINGGAVVSLTPPTDGPTAGVSMFADRNIPVGTSYGFNGGATQYIGGAIYIPTGDVKFAGGAGTTSTCTKLIADTITFTGNSNFAIDCKGYGTKAFGPSGVRLAS
jgi:hypothetical protein